MNQGPESSLAALTRIGWRPQDQPLLDEVLASGRFVARVVQQHRSGYRVHDGRAPFEVAVPAAMARAGVDPLARPAVGDWVVLTTAQPARIERLLPRRSALRRTAAGERRQIQVIAANIDVVFVVCGLDNDFNLRRIERYLVLVHDSGARPVVVLSKADRASDHEARRKAVEALAPGLTVLALNAKDPATAQTLEPLLGAGTTAVLVGSSGAGKSTLTNTLLGFERQKTATVRTADSRGRHTTVHRALLPLPSGACLIDTPGMRELKLTGDEELEHGQFADITQLASNCRFRDCAHLAEPGCAVQAALASGGLAAGRWENWRKLHAERSEARDSRAVQQAKKGGTKATTGAFGKRLTKKHGSR